MLLQSTAGAPISRFDQLHIGPLVHNRIVRQLFGLDAAAITTGVQMKPLRFGELLRHLHAYLQESGAWSQRVQDEQFAAYLTTTCKCTYAELGVRLNNVGILVGTLKSVQHIYAEALRATKERLGAELMQLVENERALVVRRLGDKFAENCNNNSTELATLIADFWSTLEKMVTGGGKGGGGGGADRSYVRYMINALYSCSQSDVCLRDTLELAVSVCRSDVYASLARVRKHLAEAQQIGDATTNQGDVCGEYARMLRRLFQMLCEAAAGVGNDDECDGEEAEESRARTRNWNMKKWLNSWMHERGMRLQVVWAASNDNEPRLVHL